MVAKVMNGARGKVSVNGKPVGIFNSISYGQSYDLVPISILGAYAPVESVYTAQSEIGISCSGWRVIDHGPHAEAAMPTLAELLRHEYIEITVFDRLDNDPGGKPIAKFHRCRPTGYSMSIVHRQPSEAQINYMALRMDDETASNDELPTASVLP
jgi:hypothetical protein